MLGQEHPGDANSRNGRPWAYHPCGGHQRNQSATHVSFQSFMSNSLCNNLLGVVRKWQNGSWGNWQDLGRSAIGRPALHATYETSINGARTHVYAQSTEKTIIIRAYDERDGEWGEWTEMGKERTGDLLQMFGPADQDWQFYQGSPTAVVGFFIATV